MKFKLQDILKSEILVIGDCMLDRYWHGITERISPEAPVPIVKVCDFEERPGGAANVALNVTSLGGKVLLAGLRGDDQEGEILSSKLNAAEVSCLFKIIPNKPTITKLRVLSLHQQLLRLDFEERYTEAETKLLYDELELLVPNFKLIIFSDYAKGTINTVRNLIQIASAHKIPVLIDPKGSDYKKYQGATLITPNFKEFQQVVGKCDTEEQIVVRGRNLMAELNLKALLITRGDKGMTLVNSDTTETHLPAVAREVYDVTGAGDTVIAVLGMTLAANADLVTATGIANCAASLVVQKLGAASLNFTELQRAVYDVRTTSKGIMTQEQLAIAIADAKWHGKKIVFTNGCFDILHPGHVEYLKLAKELGDKLVVAVNSDQSVKRLKGESRPINTLSKRMAILAALECVDWVVDFSEDTPMRLIEEYNPDVLVKGGDYSSVDEIIGSKWVIEHGGEVKILPFLQGCSTTSVIKKIKDEEWVG